MLPFKKTFRILQTRQTHGIKTEVLFTKPPRKTYRSRVFVTPTHFSSSAHKHIPRHHMGEVRDTAVRCREILDVIQYPLFSKRKKRMKVPCVVRPSFSRELPTPFFKKRTESTRAADLFHSALLSRSEGEAKYMSQDYIRLSKREHKGTKRKETSFEQAHVTNVQH